MQYVHGDGVSWSERYHLETAASTELPAFAVDQSDGLHLVWQDWAHVGENWYPETVRYATGSGDQWSNGNEGVVVHTYADDPNPPEIAVSPEGTLVVTWIEGTAVLASASSDSGQTWSSAAAVADDARPVGELGSDLRTPPSVFTSDFWHLVYENGGGQLVHVSAATTPADDARFVSQSVPSEVESGSTFDVTMTIENTGTASWSAAEGYGLGSQQPAENAVWGTARIPLAGGDSVAAGASVAFSAELTAPATAGEYAFQWQMVHEGVGWFGEPTTSLTINVTGSSGTGGGGAGAGGGAGGGSGHGSGGGSAVGGGPGLGAGAPGGSSPGCGCRVSGASHDRGWFSLLVGLGLLGLVRVRMRSNPHVRPRQ